MRVVVLLVVLGAGAVSIHVGTDRLTTTCGESFGRVDGRLVAGRPFAPALATGLGVGAADRRDLAASARAIAPGAGVGAPAWATATKFPLQVVGLSDRIVVRDLGTVGALRASDGRLLWQRRLPHLPGLLEPWRDGVVVLSAPPAGHGGAVRVALLDRDGGLLRCMTLRADAAPDRFHVATTAGGAVAVLEGGVDRRPRLTRLQGAGRLVIGHAVLHEEDGDELSGRLVALDLRSGRPAWRTPRTVELRPADTFEVAGDLVLLAPRGPSQVVALDASTGRRRWRSDALGAAKGSLLRTGERIYVTGGRPAILDARNGSKLLLSRRETLAWFGTVGALTEHRLAIVVDSLRVLIAWGRT